MRAVKAAAKVDYGLMKKKRMNFVGEAELKNINLIIEKSKFNKKSLRKSFNDITVTELCSKKSYIYLTELEVPSRIREKAEAVRTLFVIPVVR